MMKIKLNGITDLTLDFKDVDYVSSQCFRSLIYLNKFLVGNMQGLMKLVNVSDDIMDVFRLNGLDQILTIE